MPKFPVLLAAATLLPIAVLSWLGVRILEQDRDLARQRRRESLEVGAGRIALHIGQKLQDIEEQLGKGGGIPLAAMPQAEAPASLFAASEAAEFQRRDLHAAASAYRNLAKSPKPPGRAAALVRLARVLRQLGDRPGAAGDLGGTGAPGHGGGAGHPPDV